MQLESPPAELVRATLPDGQEIWLKAESLSDSPQDIGIAASLPIEGFVEILNGVTTNVRAGLERLRPDEASVEFGIEFSLGSGGVVAALAGISGKASVKVTAVWKNGALAPTSP
ncbi:CU044_2847 family protein [Dactylosporangium sp. CS-033363]|uniref:CU044_2847 family protein n=1 Tax=Dactylosporangium sp. CS-033363 TaxID=3239935 RepID=UPI003D934567